MGYGTYDSGASAARATRRISTNTSAFTHDSDIKSGKKTAGIHDTLNLTLKPRRECRDNDDNPLSVPIGVICDVTGSMGRLADNIINELHKVISAVQAKGVVEHPAIIFGAVGDAYSDQFPMQLGEFESHDELAEQHLANIYREGNGGGQASESYDIPLWVFANQVDTDHWDKRGEKGFLFLIGDEGPYAKVMPQQIKDHCGVDISEPIDLKTVCDQLTEKWHVFLIRPGDNSYFNNATIQKTWEDVLGAERVLKVEDWHDINSVIAGTISVTSGVSLADTMKNMKDSDLKTSDTVSTILSRISSNDSIVSADTSDTNAPASRL